MNFDGSKWAPELARALQTDKDSLQNIADKVKKTVHELPGKKQQCESVSRLKKESRLPEVTQPLQFISEKRRNHDNQQIRL